MESFEKYLKLNCLGRILKKYQWKSVKSIVKLQSTGVPEYQKSQNQFIPICLDLMF